MNVGKLYRFKKYFWLIFPSKNIATYASSSSMMAMRSITAEAAYYSKQFNSKVSYIEPNSMFILLEQDGNYHKVLSNNGELGWINLTYLCKNHIEEVNQ
jgi:hypothetical protein